MVDKDGLCRCGCCIDAYNRFRTDRHPWDGCDCHLYQEPEQCDCELCTIALRYHERAQ